MSPLLPGEKVPSHMTFRRIFQEIIDPEELEEMMQAFQHSHYQPRNQEVLSMEGKTVRGTHPPAVYAPRQGLTLAQRLVANKENKILAAPQVLQEVRLQGAIVMGDAMHTQQEIPDQIVTAGGDYLWIVREN